MVEDMRTSRTPVRVVLALTLLLGLGGLVAPPAAEAKKVTTKPPNIRPAWPLAGETVTVAGTLGRSVRRPVKLQRNGGGGWMAVAKGKATKRGRYSFALTHPDGGVQWRVVAPRKHALGKVFPKRVSKVARSRSLTQSAWLTMPQAVTVGTAIHLTITLSPIRPGRPIYLQRNSAAGWQSVASMAETGIGQAITDYPALEAGEFQFRVVQAAFGGAAESVGGVMPLTVLPAGVQVMANGGAATIRPENTKSALNQAVKMGADWLRLDVQQTAPDPDPDGDGPLTEGPRHWVLVHDSTFARTTNIASVFPGRVNDPVGSFTLAEIKQLDAGAWKSADFGCKVTSPTANCRVPELGEALAFVAVKEGEHQHPVRLLLEHRYYGADADAGAEQMTGLYDAVKALHPDWIRADDHADKVVFGSLGYATEFGGLREPPYAADGAELAAVIDDPAHDTVPSWAALALFPDAALTPAGVQSLHAAGVPLVGAGTVDTADQVRSAALRGADVVVTNAVNVALTALLR